MVLDDAVVLVWVGLLPEEDVLLLQGGRQQHGLLVVDVVVLGPVDQEERFESAKEKGIESNWGLLD